MKVRWNISRKRKKNIWRERKKKTKCGIIAAKGREFHKGEWLTVDR